MQLPVWTISLLLLQGCWAQDGLDPDGEDRRLHKHKHKHRRPYQQQLYSQPCGYGRDYPATGQDDGRSIKLLAALGGAAVGYKLGSQHHQQPIINNNVYNGVGGGGAPCGIGGIGGGGVGGGGGYPGGLLGSHPVLAGALGTLGGLGGLGGSRYLDRTARQFERHVVRPVTRWFR